MFRVTEYIKDGNFHTPGDNGFLRTHAIRYLANGGYAKAMVSVGQILGHRDGVTKLDSIVVNYLVDGERVDGEVWTQMVSKWTDLMVFDEVLQFMRLANAAIEAGESPKHTTLVLQF